MTRRRRYSPCEKIWLQLQNFLPATLRIFTYLETAKRNLQCWVDTVVNKLRCLQRKFTRKENGVSYFAITALNQDSATLAPSSDDLSCSAGLFVTFEDSLKLIFRLNKVSV